MDYTAIPGLERRVSRIGLGTWAIGGWMWGGADDEQSIRTIHAALDRGINLIDTAPVYGFGRSEEVVGRALAQRGRRHEVIISTKCGLNWKDERPYRDSRPERLREEIEQSLSRLGVETIDIYHVHWPDTLVPFEETAGALERMRKDGKIRAAAVSNFTPPQMEAFRQRCPLAASQSPYNLFERDIETDILPYCRSHGIGLIAYGALCRGLLSGKMTLDREFRGDDLRKVDPKFKPPRFSRYLAAVDRLDEMAKKRHDKTVIELAARWLIDRGTTVALWGARRPEQLEPIPELFGWMLGPDDLKEIDELLHDMIPKPVGPGFMGPPKREASP